MKTDEDPDALRTTSWRDWWPTPKQFLVLLFVASMFCCGVPTLLIWGWAVLIEQPAAEVQMGRIQEGSVDFLRYKDELLEARRIRGSFPKDVAWKETYPGGGFYSDMGLLDKADYWSDGSQVVCVWWGGNMEFDVDFDELIAELKDDGRSALLTGNFIVGLHDQMNPEHQRLAMEGDVILYIPPDAAEGHTLQ